MDKSSRQMERSYDVTTAERDGPAQWAAPGQNALGLRLNDMRTLYSFITAMLLRNTLFTNGHHRRTYAMQTEVLLPHSQKLASCPYPESQQSPTYFFNIDCNIIFPSMPRSSTRSLSIRSPHQNLACASPVSHMCHMPSPSHTSWCLKLNILKIQTHDAKISKEWLISWLWRTPDFSCRYEQLTKYLRYGRHCSFALCR